MLNLQFHLLNSFPVATINFLNIIKMIIINPEFTQWNGLHPSTFIEFFKLVMSSKTVTITYTIDYFLLIITLLLFIILYKINKKLILYFILWTIIPEELTFIFYVLVWVYNVFMISSIVRDN